MPTPSLPYVISGVVYDVSDNVAAGETITAFNETTNELITSQSVTNAQGQYLIDLANFPSGYSEGDFIRIAVVGSGTLGQDLKFKTVCYTDFVQINELGIEYEV